MTESTHVGCLPRLRWAESVEADPVGPTTKRGPAISGMRGNRWTVRGAAGATALAVLVLTGCNLGNPPVTYEVLGGGLTDLDLEGDGDVDFVVGSDWPSYGVMVNDGSGTFTTSTVEEPLGDRVHGSGDFDGDGRDDLLTSEETGGAVQFGDGTGRLEDRHGLRVGHSSCERSMVPEDLDGDGVVDVALTGSGVTVHRNAGGRPRR